MKAAFTIAIVLLNSIAFSAVCQQAQLEPLLKSLNDPALVKKAKACEKAQPQLQSANETNSLQVTAEMCPDQNCAGVIETYASIELPDCTPQGMEFTVKQQLGSAFEKAVTDWNQVCGASNPIGVQSDNTSGAAVSSHHLSVGSILFLLVSYII